MRKIYIIISLFLSGVLSLGFFQGFSTEKDATHLLVQKVGSGWESPQRVPITLIAYAAEKNYGAEVERIWPILGKGDRLAAYGVDLKAKPYERNLWRGIPGATALILSASFDDDAVLAEYHGAKIEDMFACPNPEKLYLTHEIGIVSICNGKPMVGKKVLSPEVFRSVVEDLHLVPERSRADQRVSLLWDRFLRAAGGERVYFTEFDWVYPISLFFNGLHFVPIIIGAPHSENHGGVGYYWGYWVPTIDMVGLSAAYARFVWYGQRTETVRVQVRDLRMKEIIDAPTCDKEIAGRGFGLYVYPDGTCNTGGKVRTTIPETLVPKPVWDFYKRNDWFWQHHRYYNTGVQVVMPFLGPYGRFRYENWTKPAWEDTAGWYRYLKERVRKRAIMLEDSLDQAPYGIPGSMTPYFTACGWDDGKQLICHFSTYRDEYIMLGVGWNIPAGFTFVSPRALRNWPGWLYPPQDYTDLPPAMTFPTRVMAYQGDEVTIEAERVWDAEGENVSYTIDSPFPLIKKGKNSFTILAQGKPRKEYVIWVEYTDGVNKVVHPVFVYVFPTFSVGDNH